MSAYQLAKDSDIIIEETVEGQDISGASIVWILTRLTTALTADLDSLSSDDKLIEKTTNGGGVSITDGPNGVFQVTIDDSDTATLVPDLYRIIARVTLSGGSVVPLESYTVEVTA